MTPVESTGSAGAGEFSRETPSFTVPDKIPSSAHEEVHAMAKYMVLLYANESGMPRPGTPEFDAQNAAYGAVYEDLSKRGAFVSGDPLGASAIAFCVRVRNGLLADTPGPASAGEQQLFGYYVLNCC